MTPVFYFLAGLLAGALLVLYASFRAEGRQRRRESRYLFVDGEMDERQY